MDLRPSDEQQQLIEAFRGLYAKESSPERVRAAEPLGFDRALWDKLAEQGLVAMAVGEDRGGWGASRLDLELVAEEHGRDLGSAPVIEAQVAATLLAHSGEAGADALAPAVTGERLVTFAVRPARDGRAALVPGGAVADDAVVLCGDELRLVSLSGDRVTPESSGSMPLADLPVDGGTALLRGDEAVAAFEAAVDQWLGLTAAALVGIAQRSLEIGVEYVKEREAFGQKIGAFQAISHRLADSAAAIDGAQLLAREAAWAADEEPGRAGELAAMAFGFAAETARDVTARALHFHGGYGFMVEYDIQLYYRRARAWANVAMSPAAAYRRIADRRYGPRGAA